LRVPDFGMLDGRPEPLVRQLARQHDLHVAGALELLEDHLVEAAPRVHEGGRDDREAAACSMLRAAPKKRLGFVSALASRPP